MRLADVAGHLMPWLEREWDDRYEAECEPFPGVSCQRLDRTNVVHGLETHHLLTTLAEKLPQLWHCAVMFS